MLGAAAVGVVTLASGCVSDLGLPDGFHSGIATAVAPNGLVAGGAQHFIDQFPFIDRTEAFLLVDGEYMLIPAPAPYSVSWAADVNSSGTVAGFLGNDPGQPRAAFVWNETDGAQTLPVSDLSTDGAQASAVNEGGQVVGTRWPGSNFGASTAFLWTPGEGGRILAPLPGMSWAGAMDINDGGQVVGVSGTAAGTGTGTALPVLWEPPLYEPIPLPTPPGPPPNPSNPVRASIGGIDHDGTVVGRYWNGESSITLRWSPGPGHPFTVLADLTPTAIDNGRIVGWTQAPDRSRYAVLLEPAASEPENLGRLDGGDSFAWDISGSKIVGSSTVDGSDHPAEFTKNP